MLRQSEENFRRSLEIRRWVWLVTAKVRLFMPTGNLDIYGYDSIES